jgi:oxygen-independent coproporphyrinogen-3 oxidase
MAYWLNQDWWGFGAGAHSYLNGRRWWNVKHPAAYATRVLQGLSPEHDGEIPTAEETQLERVLLGTRLRSGFDVSALEPSVLSEIVPLVREGLIESPDHYAQRIVLTLKGRLLADAVVRRLTT